MSDEQRQIDICRFTTLYEVITAIFKDSMSIDEMRKMLRSLERYVDAEEQHMRPK